MSTFNTLPRERADDCRNVCTTLGLTLASVVVIADAVGCVCDATGGSKSSAGAAAYVPIMLAERERQAQSRPQTNTSVPRYR